jgi:hypothetical protein
MLSLMMSLQWALEYGPWLGTLNDITFSTERFIRTYPELVVRVLPLCQVFVAQISLIDFRVCRG